MPLTRDNLHDVLQYHPADEDQIRRMGFVRDKAEAFIAAIMENAPNCADTTAATRKAREAMMTANAAIVLKGAV